MRYGDISSAERLFAAMPGARDMFNEHVAMRRTGVDPWLVGESYVLSMLDMKIDEIAALAAVAFLIHTSNEGK